MLGWFANALMRGYDERDRQLREQPSRTYIIPHRGDPCILCRKPMDEVEPGGCPVTVRQIYSRIGQVEDEATAAWERSGDDTADPSLLVAARRLEEEAKRLRLLHLVLTRDLVPASDLAVTLPKQEGA